MKYKIIAIVSRKSDEKDGGSYGHWLSPTGNKPTAITINKTLIFHQNMNNMDNLQELDDRLYTKNAAITPSHFWWILLN